MNLLRHYLETMKVVPEEARKMILVAKALLLDVQQREVEEAQNSRCNHSYGDNFKQKQVC